jgi:hypothetical protein
MAAYNIVGEKHQQWLEKNNLAKVNNTDDGLFVELT